MKEPIRGALRRRIEKIERPKSLFGNIPYAQEQTNVAEATDKLFGVVVAYRPEITLGIENPFRYLLPRKLKENKIRKSVMIAYQDLKEIV